MDIKICNNKLKKKKGKNKSTVPSKAKLRGGNLVIRQGEISFDEDPNPKSSQIRGKKKVNQPNAVIRPETVPMLSSGD